MVATVRLFPMECRIPISEKRHLWMGKGYTIKMKEVESRK